MFGFIEFPTAPYLEKFKTAGRGRLHRRMQSNSSVTEGGVPRKGDDGDSASVLLTSSLDCRLGVWPTLWWLPAGEREPGLVQPILEIGPAWNRPHPPEKRSS